MANAYLFAGAGIAVGAVGLAVAALTMQRPPSLPSPPAAAASLPAATGTAARLESRPSAVIEAYLAQRVCLDRAKYVLSPGENRAAMAGFYGAKACDGGHPSLDDAACASLRPGGSCNVVARWTDGDVANFCVTSTATGPLIDWRCSVGYGPVPLKVYKATMPKGPAVFRLYGAISDYYNFAFTGARATHYAVDLTTGDGNGERVFAYLSKSAATAPAMFALLADGKRHAMMVELDYRGSAESSVATMTRFVADSWLQQPEEVARPAGSAP